MFEAVIFDWDGTLADTRQVVVSSFQQALRENRVQIGDEFIERRIGIGSEETFREILRTSGTRINEALVKSLVQKKIQTEIDLSSKVKPFEGAAEILESLRGNVKLALASMNNRDVINYLLSALNVRKFFDTVLTGDEVQHAKPDPEIFLKCALKLGSSAAKCAVVEDSIFGVKAAKAAKMGCIAVLTGVYSREELEKEGPDLIVNSLREKEEILNLILR
jgi:HAD superfamily hydrolase (TIGR01509 family)